MDKHTLTLLAVYDKPLDHPEHVVVRPWFVRLGRVTASPAFELFATLEEARAWIAREFPHMTRLERYKGDEPQIVECWL